MRVVYLIGRGPTTPQWTAGAEPVALAVSDWDGVHRGQVALAQRAAALAQRLGGSAVALLPWPSPAASSDDAPGVRLATLEERIVRLAALGCIETLLVAPAPTEALSGAAALDWMRQAGNVRALLGEASEVTDADETLRQVWPAELAALAQAEGLAVERGPWSAGETTAAIRELLLAGRMRETTRALGYAYSVTGEVVGGDRRGRTLGFPTANLRLEPAKLAPPNGIYAGWARLPGDAARWPAAISIGVRPTFGEGLRQQIEAHLIDATMDLYGVQLQVEFVEYLREELRFAGFEALIEQMERDREHARELLEAESNRSEA